MSTDAREHAAHLLPAGAPFRQGYGASAFLAVCGEPVTSGLDGGDVNLGYCPECVRAALTQLSADVDPCPGCGATREVKVIPGTSPKVQAWSCSGCGTEWALTVVSPRSYLDYLLATVDHAGARCALRALLTLADDAPTLTDADLRARLMALAGRAVMGSR